MRTGTRSRSTACAGARRTEPEPSGGRNRTARRNSKRANGLPLATADAATEPRRAPTEPGRGRVALESWEPGNLASCRSDGGVVRSPVFQVSSSPDRGAGSRPSISQNGQNSTSHRTYPKLPAATLLGLRKRRGAARGPCRGTAGRGHASARVRFDTRSQRAICRQGMRLPSTYDDSFTRMADLNRRRS